MGSECEERHTDSGSMSVSVCPFMQCVCVCVCMCSFVCVIPICVSLPDFS